VKVAMGFVAWSEMRRNVWEEWREVNESEDGRFLLSPDPTPSIVPERDEDGSIQISSGGSV
jgi:hypothetical protein